MEDFLRLSTEEIVTRLGSDNVLWKLWSQKVITSEELEVVQNFRLRENRRKLISVLITKDAKHIDTIIQIIETCVAGADDFIGNLKQFREQLAAANLLSPSLPTLGIWYGMTDLVYNFTGRVTEIEQLLLKLLDSKKDKSASTLAQLIGITGLGGIGKSTLAKKCCYEFRDKFPDGNVIFINAQNHEVLRSQFLNLGSQILGATAKVETPGDLKHLVYNIYVWFGSKAKSSISTLFVFDNAEDYDGSEGIEPFLPSGLPPHVSAPYFLITTRNESMLPREEQIFKLDLLSLQDASSMVRKSLDSKLTSDPEREIGELIEELDRLPLALQQAIAYIKAIVSSGTRSIICIYLEEYRRNKPEVLADEGLKKFSGYHTSVLVTWQITMNKLEEMHGKLARFLVQKISFDIKNDISIDKDLLIRCKPQDQMKARRAIKSLCDYSIVMLVNMDTLQVHQIVRDVVQIVFPYNIEFINEMFADFNSTHIDNKKKPLSSESSGQEAMDFGGALGKSIMTDFEELKANQEAGRAVWRNITTFAQSLDREAVQIALKEVKLFDNVNPDDAHHLSMPSSCNNNASLALVATKQALAHLPLSILCQLPDFLVQAFGEISVLLCESCSYDYTMFQLFTSADYNHIFESIPNEEKRKYVESIRSKLKLVHRVHNELREMSQKSNIDLQKICTLVSRKQSHTFLYKQVCIAESRINDLTAERLALFERLEQHLTELKELAKGQELFGPEDYLAYLEEFQTKFDLSKALQNFEFECPQLCLGIAEEGVKVILQFLIWTCKSSMLGMKVYEKMKIMEEQSRSCYESSRKTRSSIGRNT